MRRPPLSRTFSCLVLLLSHLSTAQEATPLPEVPCYAPDGETIADDSYRPCNNLGLLTGTGIFSSCCRLNAVPDTRELCDASGLCIQGDVVRRGYCTDASWEDPACVNICVDDDDNGSSNGTAPLTTCDDGTFCCGPDSSCCDTPSALTVPSSPSPTAPSTTITHESVTVRTQTPMVVYIGMGVAILVVLLLALGVILFLLKNIKALKKRNAELMESVYISRSTAPVLPPTPHVGSSVKAFGDFNSTYGEILARRQREEREREEREAREERERQRQKERLEMEREGTSFQSEEETVVGERVGTEIGDGKVVLKEVSTGTGRLERIELAAPPIPARGKKTSVESSNSG